MQIALAKNGRKAVVDTLGGELVSYRDEAGTEYIWQGDAAYWRGRNPVLFPVVGNSKDGCVHIEGEKYAMPCHGVARHKEFTVIERGEDEVLLALCADEQTHTHYPFAFRLMVRQTLLAQGFGTSFAVENRDSREMPFCIGAHTGLVCPLYEGERFEDYVVKFDRAERLSSYVFTPEGYIAGGQMEPCLDGSDRIALQYRVFDRADTLAMEGLSVPAAELINPATGRGVRMEFAGFPMFALWTPPGKHAPFICFEPWHGCDHIQGEGAEMKDKRHCMTLAPGQTAAFSYQVLTLT